MIELEKIDMEVKTKHFSKMKEQLERSTHWERSDSVIKSEEVALLSHQYVAIETTSSIISKVDVKYSLVLLHSL